MLQFVFFRAKLSEAAAKTAISSTPAASAASRPFSFPAYQPSNTGLYKALF
jgi:hypothetical protein